MEGVAKIYKINFIQEKMKKGIFIKMKKKILIAAAAFMLAATAATAQSNFVKVSYPNDDKVLVISGNTGEKERVTVRVIALGEDGEEFVSEGNLKLDITKTDVLDNPGLLDYFHAGYSDDAGNYSFTYKTEAESGYLLVTVTAADGEQETVAYEYYSPEFAAEKLGILNEYIINEETDNISSFIKRYAKPLAVDNDYFNNEDDSVYYENIGELLIKGGEIGNKEELKETLRVATARLYAENADEDDVEKMLEDFSEFKIADEVIFKETFKNTITDEVKEKIIKDFSKIDVLTDEEFKEQIEEIIFLGSINYSAWGKIQAVLEENMDLFSSSVESAYNSLSSTKKSNVAKALAKLVQKDEYDSIEDIEADFDDAIDEEKNKKTTTSGGGGGGGGSSSALPATGSSVGSTSKTEQNKEPDKEQQNNTVDTPDEEVKTFADLVKTEWARDAVESLAKRGIISGRSETEFAPDAQIKREEFLAIVVRAFGLMDESAECNFDDVPSDAWYYTAVASAYKAGITKGQSETLFGTGNFITRQDMCVLAMKAAQIAGVTLEEGVLAFEDSDSVSEYAKSYVAAMSNAGIVNGVGSNTFAPKNTANRASAAKIVYELMKLM